MGELRRATQARAVERKKYEERRESYKEALTFLREFIEYVTKKLSKGYHAFALAEMSQNLLKHSAKLNIMTSAVPVLVAIATERAATDYTYKANQGLGDRLKETLSTLLKSIQKGNNENNAAEAESLKVFQAYSLKLNRIIATLRRNIKRVQRQIVDMNRCVQRETQVCNQALNKSQRNENLRKNAARMCKAFNKEFIQATYNRLDEIKTMNEILKIVGKRFKKLPKDLVAHLITIKDEWTKYINSTLFRKYIEYNRRQFAQNTHGRTLARANAAARVRNPTAAVVRGANGID
jgi:hypothetical protein